MKLMSIIEISIKKNKTQEIDTEFTEIDIFLFDGNPLGIIIIVLIRCFEFLRNE